MKKSVREALEENMALLPDILFQIAQYVYDFAESDVEVNFGRDVENLSFKLSATYSDLFPEWSSALIPCDAIVNEDFTEQPTGSVEDVDISISNGKDVVRVMKDICGVIHDTCDDNPDFDDMKYLLKKAERIWKD